MEISLASAFRYRNKLKGLLTRVSNSVKRCSVAVESDDVELYNNRFVTGTYDGDVQLVLDLRDLQKALNDAIDAANEGAAGILNEINSCKEKIEFLEGIQSEIAGTRLYKTQYVSEESKTVKVPLVPLYVKKWKVELDDERRRLNRCENRLSDFNGKQHVTFEVREDLQKLVEAA